MRILQTNKAYFPHLGGIESVVQVVAEGIAARDGNVSRVVACGDRPRTYRQTHNGVDVTYTGSLGRVSSLPISPAFGRELFADTADILQIHEPSLLATAAYLARKKSARSRFRGLVIWWHSDIVRQRSMAPVYRPMLRAILREANAVIVSSPQLLASSPFLREVESKCSIIPYGIEPSEYELTPDAERRSEEFRAMADGKPIVLFSGRLVYYKGVQYLVQAMRSVPQAHLIVIGQGPYLPELRRLASDCPQNVTFLSFRCRADLAAAYHAADLFVLPSVENAETFGIVQLEAMVCGKPVITSDLQTGVTYANQHGKTGLVVPRRNARALAEAITCLLDDPGLRWSMGQYAKERVLREFTSERMIGNVLSLYKNVLEGSSRAVVRLEAARSPQLVEADDP